ncbi:MAG: DNA topoisomerase IV subunit A [Acholeplasmataceae bacterium]
MSKKKAVKDVLDTFVEALIKEDFEDIISERFSRYSKYIIQERALPDARDGLKPVQRRILYAMQQMGMGSTQPYKKSARIAGEVMGKYHPHGDSSIYDAMVRLSQDFKMHLPLVDMHGNNGSIDGDTAAAMRYTEARLSKAAEMLLEDINSRTVPFIPNFDDEEVEPTVLPAKFPNLLVNGATGISAGYATKIPPHNVHEVIQATIALIKDETLQTKDLMKFIKGPDFPTGGLVQGKEGIFNALDTGSGKVVIRSQYHIEEMKKDQSRIVIDEIPYDINKAELVKSIDMLRINKKFEDIQEVRDESDKDGLRIAIELKKGKDVELAINYLLKHTDLQVNYHYNMVAILNHRPVQVGIVPILKTYIYHQKDVITNRSHYDLKKAQTRLHIVEGLIQMVSIISEIITLIRQSKNKKTAKEAIMNAHQFSDVQAEAIVTLQLYRLSNTDILSLQQEQKDLEEKILYLESILSSDEALSQVIIEELKTSDKLISMKRRSVIEADIETIKIDEKDLVNEENVMIGITKEGYIKRSNLKSYQLSQSVGMKDHDVIMYEKEHTTLQTLLIFTNLGNFIYLPIYKIDEQKWKDLGIYISNIVPLEDGETFIDIFAIDDFKVPQSMILVTHLGQIKHVTLDQFEMVRYQKTTNAMKLDQGDTLSRVIKAEGEFVSIMTKHGVMLNYHRSEIPYYGLSARGVKGISLRDKDVVTTIATFDVNQMMHVTSSRGHFITLDTNELDISKRNRKGYEWIEVVKSSPHIPLIAKAMPEHIQNDHSITVHSSKQTYTYVIKDVMSKSNKFGKALFKTKKESLIYCLFHLELKDAYHDTYLELLNIEENQVNKSTSADDTSMTSDDIKPQEIKEMSTSKENDDQKKTASLEMSKSQEVLPKETLPKKQTVKMNRLKLFEDEEEE